MIDVNGVQFNEPIYYVPSHEGTRKVEVISIKNDIAMVKQFSKKHVHCPYKIPVRFVFAARKMAKRHGRSWEHWKRKQNREKRKLNKKKVRGGTNVNIATNQTATDTAIG